MVKRSSPLLPIDEAWAWQLAARCRDEDPGIFFATDGERGHLRRQRNERAKAICAQCTVLTQCRDHALHHQEQFGIWGGLSESDRSAALRGGGSDRPHT